MTKLWTEKYIKKIIVIFCPKQIQMNGHSMLNGPDIQTSPEPPKMSNNIASTSQFIYVSKDLDSNNYTLLQQSLLQILRTERFSKFKKSSCLS